VCWKQYNVAGYDILEIWGLLALAALNVAAKHFLLFEKEMTIVDGVGPSLAVGT
jgi:hypothetical protein